MILGSYIHYLIGTHFSLKLPDCITHHSLRINSVSCSELNLSIAEMGDYVSAKNVRNDW